MLEFEEQGQPFDEWMAKFRGQTITGCRSFAEGTMLDFGACGLLIRDQTWPDEVIPQMIGQRLTGWHRRPNGLVLEFGENGLLFEGPFRIEEYRRRAERVQ